MGVPRFTTPTFRLTFTEEGLDLRNAANVFVTFCGRGVTITKTGEALTVGEKEIDVFLEQEETGKFEAGTVNIQANWTTPDGKRIASVIAAAEITPQLLRQVIE